VLEAGDLCDAAVSEQGVLQCSSGKTTRLSEGHSDVVESSTAAAADTGSSFVITTPPVTVVQPVVLREHDAMESSQATAENENNRNTEVEHGRNSACATQVNVSCRADSRNARSIPPVTRLVTSSSKLVADCNEGDEVILDVPLHDFSDEEFSNPTAAIAEPLLHSDAVDNLPKNCGQLDSAKLGGNRTEAIPSQYGKRVNASDGTGSSTDDKRHGSCEVSSRTQTDRSRNERRRSADDARSVIVAKIQRRSHPPDLPDSNTDAPATDRRTDRRDDTLRPVSVKSNETHRTSLIVERLSDVDTPKEASAGKSEEELSSVKKIKLTRPIPRTETNPLTKDAPSVKASSTNCDAGETNGQSNVCEDPEPRKAKQSSNSRNAKSGARLSPEALSKTELEILELEMRARAIKAMLRAQEELERHDVPSSSSRHGQQQQQQVDRPRQHSDRSRPEPQRRRVVEQSSRGAVPRRVMTSPLHRSALPPSTPPSRQRVIQRNAMTEIIARRRQRQLAMRDRLVRFGHQPPSATNRIDARFKLNAASVGRRVLTKPVHRSGSRIIRLSTNYVSHSSGVIPAPPSLSSSDSFHRRRFSSGSTKQVTSGAKPSGSNRDDVRRVCMTTPKRVVRVTAERSTASASSTSSKTVLQTVRKNR
jgi:hypothetical protein